MPDSKRPLAGKQIVFTGSTEPKEAVELASSLGAECLHLPLIETRAMAGDAPDISGYDWLIFTSRMGAEVFGRRGMKTAAKIAAVGEKTAEMLESFGYRVDFMPTRYSADMFVIEFPLVAGDSRCLFVRGALAKNTIASMEMPVDEWTVYETVPVEENGRRVAALSDAIVIFASPSAVSVYMRSGGGWQGIDVAAIGHITEQAIVRNGGRPAFVPEKYTYEYVIKEIVKGC